MIVSTGNGISIARSDGSIRGLTGGQMFDATGAPKGSLVVAPSVVAPVIVQVHRTAVQAIPTSAWTKVTWDAEDRDVPGFHAGSSGDLVIPASYGGDYFALAEGFWAQNGTGQRGMRLTKNGAVIAESIIPASLLAGGAGHPPLPAYLLSLIATDTVALEVYQTTPANLNFGVAGSQRSSLTLEQKGA